MPRKPRLGSHLEWNGNDIRVTITVPPSRREAFGATKAKESLRTSSPRAAEALKWAVIKRLKDRINGVAEKSPVVTANLTQQAMLWRETLAAEPFDPEVSGFSARDVLIDDVLPIIEKEHGTTRAATVLAIADGRMTPVDAFVDEMIGFKRYPERSQIKLRHAMRVLKAWCAESGVAEAIEVFDVKLARRFLHEVFVLKEVHPATARDTASWYGRYWRWCAEDSGHFQAGLKNPFATLATKMFPKRDIKAQRLRGAGKVPFTDDDVARLLAGITDEPFPDYMRVAALSGMRGSELARLTVKDCQGGFFFVDGTKTDNAVRRFPIHPDLEGIVAARCRNKAMGERLFHDLPGEESEARSPHAAMSQRFTRRRRALGVGERMPGNQQDTKDFHSFRRWFIRKAVEALQAGANGFSPWTIAEVVGHDKEDGELPLAMTMGRYPGAGSDESKRACVEAVRLPGGGQ
jgi:integrase